ncbi:MAG TPA: hypothetical protein EYM38_08410 [Dehalococcoidia bacterium]|nr:hypothetical protein [Dehalococcoidia bacterium]
MGQGESVELGTWELTEQFVHDYLSAVGDGLPVYARHGLVPPVALAARALGYLLEQLDLPPGAIHSLQEVSALAPVAVGQVVTARAMVGEPKRRGGMEFITAAVCLSDKSGNDILSSKSTVLVVDSSKINSSPITPQEESASRNSTKNQDQADPAGVVNTFTASSLPVVARTITQDQLNAYAQVSGDLNPLHLDAQFAATTQFGRIIAHGMLTLAFISEMMAEEFGKPWLESGSFRVRFKGAAYVGDSVATRGYVEKEENKPDGNQLTCAVGVSNRSAQELVSGTATVLKK